MEKTALVWASCPTEKILHSKLAEYSWIDSKFSIALFLLLGPVSQRVFGVHAGQQYENNRKT